MCIFMHIPLCVFAGVCADVCTGVCVGVYARAYGGQKSPSVVFLQMPSILVFLKTVSATILELTK